MNKEEYLHELEIRLKKYLTRAEVDDILRDYGEYFEDGRRQNKTDIEISAKLGEPEIIAQQFIEEATADKKEKRNAEMEKMKEVASNTVNLAKEKMKEAHPIENMKNISKTVGSATKKSKGPLKMMVLACWKIVGLFFGLIIGCILGFILLCMFGTILLTAVSILISGLMGLFMSIATTSFISAFFTAAGILLSIAMICVGLLLGIMIYIFIKKIYRLIELWIIGLKRDVQREEA